MTLSAEILSEGRDWQVEEGFTRRWSRIRENWGLGCLIKECSEDDRMAYGKQWKLTPKQVYEYVLVAETFPDLAKLPFGKNVTWKDLVDAAREHHPHRGWKRQMVVYSKEEDDEEASQDIPRQPSEADQGHSAQHI
jgi:hypothetical protein